MFSGCVLQYYYPYYHKHYSDVIRAYAQVTLMLNGH